MSAVPETACALDGPKTVAGGACAAAASKDVACAELLSPISSSSTQERLELGQRLLGMLSPARKAVASPAAERRVVLHRALQLAVVAVVSASELGKVAWHRWSNKGYGYWWVAAGGFSVGDTGCGGVLLDGAAALVVALVLLDALVGMVRLCCGCVAAAGAHLAAVLALVLAASADLALSVGAGGARVTLPLVLFVLSEPRYIVNVTAPWRPVLCASAAAMLAVALGFWRSVTWLLLRWSPRRGAPRWAKALLAAGCLLRLRLRGRAADGVGADLLSQLGIDLASMVRGGALPDSERDSLLETHVVISSSSGGAPASEYPPLLLFHWEAGSADLLAQASAASGNRTATPFLQSLAAREDVSMMKATVATPVTLKSAWEALCGVPAALTSDFREHGSSLRRECLPRVLARCCGYRSILAKTDKELPDLPKRVFGFDEVVVASTNEELLARLEVRLSELRGSEGDRPVFVYFYSGDAHAPYTRDRVEGRELGYSEDEFEDVFLALTRRADRVAEELARFWPPPRRPSDTAWRPEHGFAVYFGDHGEVVRRSDWPGIGDPPPHGHLVMPEVSQIFLAVESRAYRPRRAGRPAGAAVAASLRRPADIFRTVADIVGLRADGALHIGASLLGDVQRRSMATFSFYRPMELLAVHRETDGGRSETLEFSRDVGGGWWVSGGGREARGRRALPRRVEPGSRQEEALMEAIAEREHINRLLTHSNVHAAWLFARLKVVARNAAALAGTAVKNLLGFALAPPQQSPPASTS